MKPVRFPRMRLKSIDSDFLEGVPNGKVILTTVIENEKLLFELFGAKPTVSDKVKIATKHCPDPFFNIQVFLPSIPHLVYQYNLFTNYPPLVLNVKNPEIPE